MKKFVLHSQNCIDNINLYRDSFGDYLINEVLAESILKELYNYPILTRDIFQHSLYEILTENNNNKENNILINACSFDYLVFKDKFLIKNNPHLILDGSVFIAKILGIKKVDIVLKNYYLEEKDILLKTIVEFEELKTSSEVEISVYDEDSENNFDETDFEKAMKVFPKFQSVVSKYKNYARQKKECVQICKVLSAYVSDVQSLLELNKQAFLEIERYDANPGNLEYCMTADDY